MLLNTALNFIKFKANVCRNCRAAVLQRCSFSQDLETKYTDTQKKKILQVINDSDAVTLAGYEVSKGRLKKFTQWKSSNGEIKSVSDVEMIEGFSEKTATKLFDSILEGPAKKTDKRSSKIKGQVLHPHLSESLRKNCKTVLSVYITVNSVCWTLFNRSNYEVVSWQYHPIDHPEGKKFQITEILDIAWKVTQCLPVADIYVMKAEATTLRAAGSDPNNPKVIAVNLQKAQMIAMIVALINARSHNKSITHDETYQAEENLNQRVYFLRPTLPFRLYGTLVGNEKVSTDQTVEMLLQNANNESSSKSHLLVPDKLQIMFRNQKDLQKDMLGHSLLLGLTFMDICIYKNQESIDKLVKRTRE
ncbi:uncharacterized protein LOC126372515 isoform X2 [Pectinophora gossypiella]|uniref:uncharacterized protein LOC126372515 isoform X2 n=1 Tax=Pectinophora gossypiella TaxID=13191 RepID=UPI00214EB5A3|nr:uncharacterized protein LOC126372515 isoform X2 [Pectinophora gossypiella]